MNEGIQGETRKLSEFPLMTKIFINFPFSNESLSLSRQKGRLYLPSPTGT